MNPKYEPGDKVRRVHHAFLGNQDETTEIEYGIVICSWWDNTLEGYDYWIAVNYDLRAWQPSINNKNETLTPLKPYILRYVEESLMKGWDDDK